MKPTLELLLPTEALSARDIAQFYPSLTTERATRRLPLQRVHVGETGFVVEGGPIKGRGCWLATLGWWREALLQGGNKCIPST